MTITQLLIQLGAFIDERLCRHHLDTLFRCNDRRAAYTPLIHARDPKACKIIIDWPT